MSQSPTPGSGHDGGALVENDFGGAGLDVAKQGLYALAKVDLFNILCIPTYKDAGFIDVDADLVAKAATFWE